MNMNCSENSNCIFIIADKLQMEIEIDRSEALKMDSYLVYTESYRKVSGCTKYKIKERILDKQKNLLLLCDEEYIPFI